MTEQSFEELVIEELFRPLKMRSADLGVSKEGQLIRRNNKQLFSATGAELPRFWAPVSGLAMSLADFGKFLVDQMQGERGKGKLLKPDSYRFIHMRAPGSVASDGAGLGSTFGDQPFGRHLMDAAANGSVATGIMIAPGKLNAVVIVADNKNSHGERGITRALAAVRDSWVRQRRSR